MGNPLWFRSILSGIVGAAIGLIFVAIANLVSPVANLVQELTIVCVPAFLICAGRAHHRRAPSKDIMMGRGSEMRPGLVRRLQSDPKVSHYCPKIIYVLSSGAAKGFCHVGMLATPWKRGA